MASSFFFEKYYIFIFILHIRCTGTKRQQQSQLQAARRLQVQAVLF